MVELSAAFWQKLKISVGSQAPQTQTFPTQFHDNVFLLNCHLEGVGVARVFDRPNRTSNWHKQARKRIQLHQDLKDSCLPSSVPCVNDGPVSQDGNYDYDSLINDGQNSKVHNIEASHSFGHSVRDVIREMSYLTYEIDLVVHAM